MKIIISTTLDDDKDSLNVSYYLNKGQVSGSEREKKERVASGERLGTRASESLRNQLAFSQHVWLKHTPDQLRLAQNVDGILAILDRN